MTSGKRSKNKGQIAIPALLAFPVIFLLVFLIMQVNRLSREKIRQQFSLDVAATVETEQYTDLLNRMAYINGIFPQRIFRDAYGDAWYYFYLAGMYPGTTQPTTENTQNWGIRYGPGRAGENKPNPAINMGLLSLAPPSRAIPTADDVSQLSVDYIQVFQWLGRVAVHQKEVFEKLTQNKHPIARKALWTNLTQAEDRGCESGAPAECYEDTAEPFPHLNIRLHYIDGYRVPCHCPGGGVCVIYFGGDTVVGSVEGQSFSFTEPSLFQLETVPRSDLERLKDGWEVRHNWIPPPNSYGVDFGSMVSPYVRGFVAVSGGEIWPDPMPRFRGRLRP